MGQLESVLLGNSEEASSKNVNAELQNEDGLIDTDNESRFKKIMKDFTLVSHNYKDPYLGNVDVYKCIHNKNFRIYLKEMFTKSEEELNIQVEMWVKRQSLLLHPNLIQLHSCCHQKVESFCATFYKIFMLFDSVETDLLNTIKKDKIQKFSEDELWFLLDSIVGVLEFMQERDLTHQSLRLDTIYINSNHKNIKLFKLADSQLMGYTTNYENQLMQFDKYIYLSPLLFTQYGNNIEHPVHNEYKSDVFTLGMLLVHLSLFESCADVYSLIDHSINQQVLNDKLSRISNSYSSDFSQIIHEMCILDEKYRPDFRSLDRKLSSCPKLFGRRICEMVQVPNLYKMKPASFMSDQEIEQKKQEELKKKQVKENKEKQQKELTEKDIIIKAIQQQDALNILKDSIAKTSYLTEQLFRQSQRAEVQFAVDNVLLNPASQKINTNQNQIGQVNFIDQQHQMMMLNQGLNPLSGGVYRDKTLKQNSNQQQQLGNYEIPFTTNSPAKSRPLAAPQNGNLSQNIIQQNMQSNLNNLGAQQHQSQFQSPEQFNNEQDNNLINISGIHATQRVDNNNLSPGQLNDVMLTSTSKQLFIENPDLPKIINKNFIKQTIKYKNGNIYEGDVLDGKKHGYGVFIFSNQQKYEGEWQNNKRHGKGTQYFQNGSIKYQGQWQDDQYHGFGTLFYKDPQPLKILDQQMLQFQLLIQKQNTLSQAQVDQLQREFIIKVKERYYQDLSQLQDFYVKYEGDFKYGKKDGFGTIYFSNNDYFVGQFVNNQANGNGNYMYEDAVGFATGEWINDKLIMKY
ncbi:hypothetical protein ABPG72_003101 [Tetrahymena utriculariae]